eukprot:CAMPEP_0113996956 /NCGR_PEP_ID=MMETSP0328-20130328/12033_1 /TAXON_ID=39455 /ORGANISM="Alexandrium minutum" /LENGTH=42 /assembly_acc=CAM_ASM_000350
MNRWFGFSLAERDLGYTFTVKMLTMNRWFGFSLAERDLGYQP